MFREPKQVLVYCYRVKNGLCEFLMLKRPSDRGDFWQGVTGAPFKDEALPEAAKRELLEETGMVPLTLKEAGFSYSFPVEPEWQSHYASSVTKIDEIVYLAEISIDCKLDLSGEHVDYKWASFEEAITLLKYDNNKNALKHCCSLLISDTPQVVVKSVSLQSSMCRGKNIFNF